MSAGLLVTQTRCKFKKVRVKGPGTTRSQILTQANGRLGAGGDGEESMNMLNSGCVSSLDLHIFGELLGMVGL